MHFESRTSLMLELGFREEALPALKAYIDLLWSSNNELNLISRKMTFEELIDNHIVDCLLPLKHFPTGLEKAADFGSGGGMPAVIYALQFPEMSYTLYEKSPLKQDFLKKCQKIAPNIVVDSTIPLKLMGVEMVTARAFKPLDVLLSLSRGYFKEGGKYFLLKGRREKIDEELLEARKIFKELEIRVETLKSPLLDVERHLVLI